jgi:mRNA interferase RelE/StbE
MNPESRYKTRSRSKGKGGFGVRYELEFRPKALRDLKRLSPEVSRRIEQKLALLSEDLHGDVKRLVNFPPGWRLRVGEWRVLFQPVQNRVVVHRIVHRSQAYD